jgi:hypothetical protein
MTRRYFILTEAAAMAPLVRQMLIEIREARSRILHLHRELQRCSTDAGATARLGIECRFWHDKLDDVLRECDQLGIEISPGVRCEALFPFEHQWTGPRGDGRIRRAYFVFNDAQATITEWFFAGWPNDRRKVWPHWWTQFRTVA